MLLTSLMGLTFRSRTRRGPLASFRMPGFFILGVVILTFLIWMRPHQMLKGTPIPLPPQSSFSELSNAEGLGKGAGGNGVNVFSRAADCLPFDTACLVTGIASWAASQVLAAIQPITHGLLTNPADI